MILFRAMLLNRSSRAVTSKQSNLMTDHHTSSSSQSSSPIQNYTTKPLQSFFGSPRLFKSDVPLISPTSILEPFSPNKNPFSKQNIPQNKSWVKLDSNKGIGVALLGDDDNDEKTSRTKLVLFGTKLLNLQIPNPPLAAKFTADFGIKTRNSQFSKSGDNSQISTDDQVLITGCVSMSELEMSEDYTCVISYDGLNPKTTHIYDNCVLENCSSLSTDNSLKAKSFLSFCHTCEKKLEHKNDIFIYRGDEAFCSQECRHRKMVLDGTES